MEYWHASYAESCVSYLSKQDTGSRVNGYVRCGEGRCITTRLRAAPGHGQTGSEDLYCIGWLSRCSRIFFFITKATVTLAPGGLHLHVPSLLHQLSIINLSSQSANYIRIVICEMYGLPCLA